MSRKCYWDKSFMLGHAKLITLAVLSNKPLHGYGIIKEIKNRSHNCCSVTVGTIYPILKVLESEGLIKSEKITAKGREKIVYKITAKGEKVLAEGLKRWIDFTEGARKLLMADTKNERQ
ncbi:MAG: PadR family transcriptional regulator [Candidatus Bathyarchaeota archaeon]|nr:PadR family transcriptional regulator [Candidatus Bathyarchaeota archaeon]